MVYDIAIPHCIYYNVGNRKNALITGIFVNSMYTKIVLFSLEKGKANYRDNDSN